MTARRTQPVGDLLAGAPLDIIKTVAATAMVLDHVNKTLLHYCFDTMWLVGRLAFPLFTFAIAAHLVRGAQPGPYVQRLVVLAVISQPGFAIGFATSDPNTVFTLAAGAAIAALLRGQKPLVQHAVFAVGVGAIFTPWLRTRTGLDFGLAGILLPAGLAMGLDMGREARPALAAWLVPLFVGLALYPNAPLALELGGLLIILVGGSATLWLALRFRGRGRFLPRYAFYAFYPVHLLLLASARAL